MLKHLHLQCEVSNSINRSNCHPPELVGRASEAQLEVNGYLNMITKHGKC